ncbi:hypothetical protein D770_24790 [Flammeovirgaceae bacterium 311]|nr:hypothetical protein D770_24790 [Flammeovirgaceae bacterium 311]
MPGTYFEYKLGNGGFTDKIVSSDHNKSGRNYNMRVRYYSWGATDTAYFRLAEAGLMAYDQETGGETIDIPANPTTGFTWMESDNSWKYVIKATDAELTTPQGMYKNLLIIQATQLTGRDKEKMSQYHNYYAPGIGFVASMIEGQLVCYLTEHKIGDKE